MNSGYSRSKPDFFKIVADKSKSRWLQLEADPELAGPWHQLFSQVQSPRHVLSELLQNADDAGAKNVSVSIEDDFFILEHDGKDFSGDEFASLCRFGYSNKRNLHTIGFRGIGFKSTFSLGDHVDVLTPSLAVRFDKKRFTLPQWIENAPNFEKTRVQVRVNDERRRLELENNFSDWINSPASLLFFKNVQSLVINGHQIYRQFSHHGSSENALWYDLIGNEADRVLVVKSEPEAFPPEAVEEIKRERNADDLHLPPCQIEIVYGLKTSQKIFVVLPTGVRPKLPFSINGPFLQDPARFGIKDPSVSPTNRWLLERAGKLAGESMVNWLNDQSLSTEKRASAYCFLPPPPPVGNSLDENVSLEVFESFKFSTSHQPVLLTQSGELKRPGGCHSLPKKIHKIWTSEVLQKIFCQEYSEILAPAVSSQHQHLLVLMNWIKTVTEQEILGLLARSEFPRPSHWDNLTHLWDFVLRISKSSYRLKTIDQLNIAPSPGSPTLKRPNHLIRLSKRQAAFSESDSEFINSLVTTIDPDWTEFLRDKAKQAEDDPDAFERDSPLTNCLLLLKTVNLDSPSPTARILELADSEISKAAKAGKMNSSAFANAKRRLTHVYAANELAVPKNFRYITQNSSVRKAESGVLIDPEGILEEAIPQETLDNEMLHDFYSNCEDATCSAAQWRKWAISPLSQLSTLPAFEEEQRFFQTKSGLEEFLEKRGVGKPIEYQYKGRASYFVRDVFLPVAIVEHMQQEIDNDPQIWTRFLGLFLRGNSKHWSNVLKLPVYELAANGHNQKKAKCDPVTANWIFQLGEFPCLLDTFNQPRLPAELLIRTPETEPMMGVESFVKAEIDTPENRTLLEALGVRTSPAGPEKLIGRIQALSSMETPPIHELAKWYEAIDKIVARSETAEISELASQFKNNALVFTASGKWAKIDELYRYSDDEGLPDTPVIHASIGSLTMWSRLGLADRPTAELVIQWLQNIPTDKRLDSSTRKRIKGCMQTFPERVWNECECWLTLDDQWTKISNLKYKLEKDRVVKIGEIFSGIRAKTADLRDLNSSDLSKSEFNGLLDMALELQMELTESKPSNLTIAAREWPSVLGHLLTRVLLEDDPEKQKTIRDSGERLANSKWISMQSMQVTPFLEGEPAGQPHHVKVLWQDNNLYVDQCPFVTIYQTVVDELSRPFGLQSITEAIRACADRNEQFIEEYIEHHFDLAHPDELTPSQLESPPATQGLTTGSGSLKSPFNSNQHRPNQDEVAEIENSENNASVDDLNINQVDSPDSRDKNKSGNALNQEHNSVTELNDDNQSTIDGETTHGLPVNSSEIDRQNQTPDEVPNNNLNANETTESDFENSQDEKPPQRPAKKPLIERWTDVMGFTWTIKNQLASNADGFELKKASGLFNWQICLPTGPVRSRLWVTPQSLVEGVELPAEIWNVVKQSPHDCGFILEDNKQDPVEVTGEQMMDFFDTGRVKLFPSKYRIRHMGEMTDVKIAPASPNQLD